MDLRREVKLAYRKFRVCLIHAAADFASFLRDPLVAFFPSGGGRDAAHQADGPGTGTTGTAMQTAHCSTPPRAVPSGLHGPSGAEAQEDCSRGRGPPAHGAAVA